MLIALLLIAVVAPLGAFDVFYDHLYRFRLYDQPSARFESLTHLVRNLMMGLGALEGTLFLRSVLRQPVAGRA